MKIIAIFLLSLTAYAGHFSSKTFSFDASSVVFKGAKTTISFSTDEQGKIVSLFRDRWPFIEQFYTKDYALENLGFYDLLPAEVFSGQCQEDENGVDYCRITIWFSDEEITNLYLHFEGLNDWDQVPEFEGVMQEIHCDQGMVLLVDSFTFYN